MTKRRTFLTTAGAAAVYSLSGEAPKAKAAGVNSQIALGFVGVGIRGSGLMDEFSRNPASRLVVAADLYDGHLEHAKEFTNGRIETTKRYEDVLNRKDIDAVVIAVPDHWHKRMTLEALAAGKHVYIEKPMTWSLKEGPEMLAAEKKYGERDGAEGEGTGCVECDRQDHAHSDGESPEQQGRRVDLSDSAGRLAADHRLGALYRLFPEA
jgi:hypothetical protein